MDSDNSISSNKDAIIAAAREQFSKYGYKKTTLDDIARRIGKGKSSLYYYFNNKEEIFKAVLDFDVLLFKDKLINAITSENNPQSKLRTYILKRMDFYHQVVTFFGAIQQDYIDNFPMIEKARIKYDEQELEMISEIITEGVRQGKFVSKNITLTAKAIILAMKGFEYTFAKETDAKKIENDIDQLLEVLFYGIVVRNQISKHKN